MIDEKKITSVSKPRQSYLFLVMILTDCIICSGSVDPLFTTNLSIPLNLGLFGTCVRTMDLSTIMQTHSTFLNAFYFKTIR